MADTKIVDTSKYVKDGKVSVDGKIWTITLPGAGKELQLSRNQRRLKFLQKKIDSGDYDEADLDKFDDLEQATYDFFKGIFTDETEGNTEVSKWIDETPLGIIVQAFEDIKDQASDK